MSSDEILFISTLLAIALVIAYLYRLHQGTIYRNQYFLEEDLDGNLSNEVSILIISTFNSNAEDGTTF